MYKINPLTGKFNVVNSSVKNEFANVVEFDGVNKVFTTSKRFIPQSVVVMYGNIRQNYGIDYTAANVNGVGTITFLGDAPNPADNTTLYFDYDLI